MNRRHLTILLLLLTGISTSSFSAEQQTSSSGLPVWELGAGIGSIFLPHYPGADQSQALVLPFPLLVYRGEKVRADRGALRGILFESGNTRLDISIRGSLPVNSDDNRARQGMDDLDPTVEVGPQLSWTAHQNVLDTVQLRLPLRAVISIGSDGINHQGYVANPNIRWDHAINSNLRLTARAAARFGDSKWHDYFYTVESNDVSANRPQYDAAGGYGGSSLSFSGTYQQRDWRIGGAVGIEWLGNAAFADSPLVKDTQSYFVAFAVSKVLFKSKRRTQTRLDSDH